MFKSSDELVEFLEKSKITHWRLFKGNSKSGTEIAGTEMLIQGMPSTDESVKVLQDVFNRLEPGIYFIEYTNKDTGNELSRWGRNCYSCAVNTASRGIINAPAIGALQQQNNPPVKIDEFIQLKVDNAILKMENAQLEREMKDAGKGDFGTAIIGLLKDKNFTDAISGLMGKKPQQVIVRNAAISGPGQADAAATKKEGWDPDLSDAQNRIHDALDQWIEIEGEENVAVLIEKLVLMAKNDTQKYAIAKTLL